MEKICKHHGLTEHAQHKDGSIRCRRCLVDAVRKRRRNLKLLAVEYKGGECCKCGYNKCVDALEFHHLDETQKEFGIGNGNTKSWEKIKKEIDKCILVCSNCRKEIHSKLVGSNNG